MNQRPFVLGTVLLGLLLPSCFISRVRVNEAIDPVAYGRLEVGKSTQDDVLQELGAPADIVQLGFRSAWRYDHTHSKNATSFFVVLALQNVDTVQDRVWAFFDEEGLLTHIGATFDADKAEYQFPFSD